MQLFRAAIFHTPENPFQLDIGDRGALVCHRGWRAAGSRRPRRRVRRLRGHSRRAIQALDTSTGAADSSFPGFVDAHVHFPQVRIIGAMGRTLLDWLEAVALPEEAQDGRPRLCRGHGAAVPARARLARHDDGARVRCAFRGCDRASSSRRPPRPGCASCPGSCCPIVCSGPTCMSRPSAPIATARTLIERYHKRGRLLYAVTPRFAYSTTESMLEVCQQLMSEHPDVRLQTHINENTAEIAELARLFPWAADYLAIYERYELSGARSVMAHNVHATPSEIDRLAAPARLWRIVPAATRRSAAVVFPLRRHVDAGVTCALGTDVGGGSGFGMLKEGLQAYLMQRLAPRSRSARCRAIAVHGDARRCRGARARDGDRRFQAGQGRRLRASAAAGRKCARRGRAPRRRSCAGARRAVYAGGAESVREVRVEGDIVFSTAERGHERR